MLDPNLEKEMEKAIIFLCENYNKTGPNPKPVILHSIRVGNYLYNNGYSKEIILAGILHDIVEDTKVSIKQIEKEFGKKIADLVSANTFDKDISDRVEKYQEMYSRCLKARKEALIVKTADILDNTNYILLVKTKEIQNALIKKRKYFLKISKDVIGNEIVWKELKEKTDKF